MFKGEFQPHRQDVRIGSKQRISDFFLDFFLNSFLVSSFKVFISFSNKFILYHLFASTNFQPLSVDHL